MVGSVDSSPEAGAPDAAAEGSPAEDMARAEGPGGGKVRPEVSAVALAGEVEVEVEVVEEVARVALLLLAARPTKVKERARRGEERVKGKLPPPEDADAWTAEGGQNGRK